jgi:hypothetical protein
MNINISTYLNSPPETIANYVEYVKTWKFVAWPLITILPRNNNFPDKWVPGNYQVWLFAFGFIPLGLQNINIEIEHNANGYYVGRDNGSGWIAKVWNHRIILKVEGDGTLYTDNVRVEAGILTPIVWAFAVCFYQYRQRRWCQLVNDNFKKISIKKTGN